MRSSEPSEPFPEIKESRAIRHPPLPFLLLAAAALLVGWQFRQETNLMAELGFGYALSFVGGAMMLVLLLFPLRNKSRFVRNLGPVKHWFDTHILLGVLGSVLIALQNDFISSSNGRVVLFSTLFIAATGFVGRYFYTRIHESTRRITLQDLERDVEAIRDAHASVALVPEVHEQLVSIEDRMLSPPRGLLHSAFRTIGLTLKARWTKSRLARIASRELKKSKSSARITPAQRQELQRSIHGDIVERLRNVRRTARFSLHESLFRLWHALHYPLLVFLVAAGSIHALAAHV